MAGESLIIGNGNWGVKSGNLLGYNLNNAKYVPRELTFTRATTGTRTNGALLVEEVPYNLVQYSEEFDNVTWDKSNSTISANATTAPNGTLTADKLIPSILSGVHNVNRSFSISSSTAYTASVYAKKAEYSALRINYISSANTFVSVNLDTGVIASAGGTIYLSSSITNVGNGWYRITMTFTPPVGASSLNFIVENPIGTVVFSGDGTSGIYLWGAQLVEGSSPLDYLPTTTRLNIPRIDYSTGTAALLMEPQRTNIVLRSEEFDSTSWLKSGATITANDTIAPSGLLTADRITQSGAAINFNQSISLPAGVVTFTTYVKRGNFDSSSTFLFGLFSTVTGDVGYISFSFLTGTTTVYSGTFISHSATNVGNGWYRIQGTINIPSAGTAYFYNGGTGLTIAGVGSYYYSWGAQVEVGTYPTSYIPTTSATVTRNEDVSNTSGMANFIGQTEGTIFWDGIARYSTPTFSNFFSIIKDAGLSKFIYLGIINTGFITIVTPTISYEESSVAVLPNTRFKLALRYKAGDWAMYLNGVQVWSKNAAVSAGTYDIIQQTYGGNYLQTNQVYSHMLYKTGLSNAELAILTTK